MIQIAVVGLAAALRNECGCELSIERGKTSPSLKLFDKLRVTLL